MPFEKGNNLTPTKRERSTKEIRELRAAGYDEMIKAISCIIMPTVYEKVMDGNLFKDIDPHLLELVENIKDKAFSNDPKATHSLNFLFDRLVGKPEVNLNINDQTDSNIVFKFPERIEKEIQGKLLEDVTEDE